MGLVVGMAIVAGLFYLAHQQGWDWHHGLDRTHWQAGPPPMLLVAGFAVLLIAMLHMLPLLMIGAGGYFLFRVLSHNTGSLRSLSFGGHGPGGVADPVEEGVFCPSCNGAVSRNWATCPHCGYRKYVAPDLIQRRCTTCGTTLQNDWKACPYCSTTIQEPVTAAAPGPAQTPGPTTTALL